MDKKEAEARPLMGTIFLVIREYGSNLYVGLARATNTNFLLTFLLTRLQEALYENLAV